MQICIARLLYIAAIEGISLVYVVLPWALITGVALFFENFGE